MDLIDRVKEFVLHLGVSEREFASVVGVGQRSVNYYFKGEQKPSLEFLSKLALAYPTVNIDWLITGEGEMLKSNKSVSIFLPLKTYPKQVGKLYLAPIYESYPC